MFAPYHLLFLLENSRFNEESEQFIARYVREYAEAEWPLFSLDDHEYLLARLIKQEKRAKGVFKRYLFALQRHFSDRLDSDGEYCPRARVYYSATVRELMTIDEWRRFVEEEVGCFVRMIDRQVKIGDEKFVFLSFLDMLKSYVENYELSPLIYRQIKLIFQHSVVDLRLGSSADWMEELVAEKGICTRSKGECLRRV